MPPPPKSKPLTTQDATKILSANRALLRTLKIKSLEFFGSVVLGVHIVGPRASDMISEAEIKRMTLELIERGTANTKIDSLPSQLEPSLFALYPR